MLVLLSHTLLDHLGQLVASQTSLLPVKLNASLKLPRSKSSSRGYSSASRQSPTSLTLAPRRTASNPFDVLYGAKPLPPHPAEVQLRQYLHIEQELRRGHSPRPASPLPGPSPIVTVVLRSGSVVSRLATLRQRNTIRRRNKMVRRADSDKLLVFSADAPKAARRLKIAFVFPVKRRTLFKYHPVRAAQKFHSQQEVDNFFVLNNVAAVMKDVLPRQMNTYRFTHLAKVDPTLVAQPAEFAISRDARFTLLQPPLPPAVQKAVFQGRPLTETARKSVAWEREPAKQASPDSEHNSAELRRQQFLASVYSQYRAAVFAGRYQLPPKTEDMLPFEADIMTPQEKEKMDKQLLLEALLRRTVAAKIDFRLSRSGYAAKRADKADSSSSSRSDKPGRRDANRPDPGRNTHHRRSPSTRSSSDLAASLDTDELMQHNASLLSELLPSPQMSFSSNIFDRGMYAAPPAASRTSSKREAANVARSGSSLAPKSTSSHMARTRLDPRKSNVARSASSLAPKNTPKKSLIGSSVYSDGSPKKIMAAADMYIYDFEKLNIAPGKKGPERERNLSNLNLYSLQPLNRSNTTLSTNSGVSSPGKLSVSEGNTFGARSTPREQMNYDALSLASTPSISHGHNRASRSTAETSVLHSLENITRRVSEYLESEGGTEYSLEFPLRRPFEMSPKSAKSPTMSMSDSLDFNIRRTELMPPSRDSTAQPTPTSGAFGSPAGTLNPPSRAADRIEGSTESIVRSLRQGPEYNKGLLVITPATNLKPDVTQHSGQISSVEGSFHGGKTASVSAYSRFSMSECGPDKSVAETEDEHVLRRDDSALSMLS